MVLDLEAASAATRHSITVIAKVMISDAILFIVLSLLLGS
jgi:hypothetical protein